jgi:cyclase
MVLDIDASNRPGDPDFKMIQDLAVESRMPLCYGGGVKTVEQAKTIIGLGVEKVAISSAAIEDPGLVARVAAEVGSQSVVGVLDVRRRPGGKGYEVFTRNGTRKTGKEPAELARELERNGVGEIVVNSIDNDGMMKGYDLALAREVREAVTVPMTIVGGAGSLKDIGALIAEFGVIGASAGSLFVFKGIYRAVLISYPNLAVRDELIRENLG